MNIESETVVTPVEEGNEAETVETTETGTEAQDPKETPEAKYARLTRQAKQLAKKHGFDVEETKPSKAKQGKSQDFDYGEKAYLVANGIKGSDEMAMVRQAMAETGRTLDEVLESKFFQASLRESREAKLADQATPKGQRKTSSSTSSDVDYWIAKDELPPNTEEFRKLRSEVVNEKIRREKSKSVFGTGKLIVK